MSLQSVTCSSLSVPLSTRDQKVPCLAPSGSASSQRVISHHHCTDSPMKQPAGTFNRTRIHFLTGITWHCLCATNVVGEKKGPPLPTSRLLLSPRRRRLKTSAGSRHRLRLTRSASAPPRCCLFAILHLHSEQKGRYLTQFHIQWLHTMTYKLRCASFSFVSRQIKTSRYIGLV